MTREKSYDVKTATTTIMDCFINYGYSGTSLDIIVKQTGILRGSLYAAFGSKKGMFIAVLNMLVKEPKATPKGLSVALISLMELTSKSNQIKKLTLEYLEKVPSQSLATTLGAQILIHGQPLEEK